MATKIHNTLQFNRIYAPELSFGGVLAFFVPVFHHLNIFNGFNKMNKENSIYSPCNTN